MIPERANRSITYEETAGAEYLKGSENFCYNRKLEIQVNRKMPSRIAFRIH
ncbi:MAG: hypothetical protein MK106_12215 [Mariniblastus sp.]|nr:hypothetical protein [Mariniblastus sp.]